MLPSCGRLNSVRSNDRQKTAPIVCLILYSGDGWDWQKEKNFIFRIIFIVSSSLPKIIPNIKGFIFPILKKLTKFPQQKCWVKTKAIQVRKKKNQQTHSQIALCRTHETNHSWDSLHAFFLEPKGSILNIKKYTSGYPFKYALALLDPILQF